VALALVNAGANQDYSGSSTTVVSPTFNLTAGNTVAFWFRAFDDDNLPVVSDTAGNNYSIGFLNKAATGSGSYLLIAYQYNCNGHASNVITVTSATNRFWGATYAQFSGTTTATSSVDQLGVGANASGTTVTSAAFTTVQADEVIVACGNPGALGTWTPDTGFTTCATDALGIATMSYKIVSAIQTGATVTYTYSVTTGLDIFIATFKAIAGAAPTRPRIFIAT
jgi:hypothetical protein